MQRIAVIGGTGMKELVSGANIGIEGSESEDSIISLSKIDKLSIETEYGEVPAEVLLLTRHGHGELRIFIIHRHHGEGKTTPPHLINYHANVSAAASCQPDIILSIQSVGAIDPNFPPGTVGMAEHTLDFCSEPVTFSTEDAHHADMTHHYPKYLRDLLRPILAEQSSSELTLDHVVSHMPGPQFETPAEIEAWSRLGATAASMTISPEARLIAETGIPHVGLIASSNWAAGKTPGDSEAKIDHESVESKAADMHGTIWNCLNALLTYEE